MKEEAMNIAVPTMVLKQPKPRLWYKSDWETIEDVGPVVGEPTLELSEFLEKDESCVVGTTMLERAKALGNLAGQFHAERLFLELRDIGWRDSIPVEWRQYNLIFAGTTRRSPGRVSPCVLCFYWWTDSRRGWGAQPSYWRPRFYYLLDDHFYGDSRLVRLGNGKMGKEATTRLPTMVFGPLPTFEHESNWETIEDVGPVVGEPTLKLNEFLLKGEDYVVSTEMVKRAKALGDLAGQLHAERLLKQQDSIPVEWQRYVLIFAGTIRRSPQCLPLYQMRPCVLCLSYGGAEIVPKRWDLSFIYLGSGPYNGLFGTCRIVRLCR